MQNAIRWLLNRISEKEIRKTMKNDRESIQYTNTDILTPEKKIPETNVHVHIQLTYK